MLDRCEGRDDRFRLAGCAPARCAPRTAPLVDAPWCYLGHAAIRRPLLVDGRAVRCADVPQAAAVELTGDAAAGDGLDADTVHGEPHPDEWPAALFAYGLLQPGSPSWDRVAAHADGRPRRGAVDGTVLDTGRGYPALLPGTGDRAPGWLVPLRDPAAVLPALDDYEGVEYRRIRLAAAPGRQSCWAYAWSGPSGGMTPLAAGWPPDSADLPAVRPSCVDHPSGLASTPNADVGGDQ